MSELKVGIQLVPQFGSMALMRQRWMEAEELGADAVYTCDHFLAQRVNRDVVSRTADAEPAYDGENFEATTIQAAIAATTSRIEIGCIVHANSYRNPNLMADIARTIDHISAGRFILGMGSGYQKPDYDEYGYEFGTQKSRLLDLARDIPIIKSRFGKLNPKPLRKIPLMIASMGEKIGMRIVAEHADIWNGIGPVDLIRQKIEVLKRLCDEVGRDFGEIELSAYYLPGQLPREESDPEKYRKLGVRNLIALAQGPDWDFEGLHELLAWRKAAK